MSLTVDGHCEICEQPSVFSSTSDWLRDHFKCVRCGSIPRERALMSCLWRYAPDWRAMRIFESSPVGRGVSAKLACEAPGYVGSQYSPDVPTGVIAPHGYRNESLERLTFPDESFDLVVTQDVMEHVFDAAAAFGEIARVLRPGGLHVFTTPLVRNVQRSVRRARLEPDGRIVHFGTPEYHGNPVDPSGSLVTFHWGYDITHHILAASGMPSAIVLIEDLSRGIKAELNEVIVSYRPEQDGGIPDAAS